MLQHQQQFCLIFPLLDPVWDQQADILHDIHPLAFVSQMKKKKKESKAVSETERAFFFFFIAVIPRWEVLFLPHSTLAGSPAPAYE